MRTGGRTAVRCDIPGRSGNKDAIRPRVGNSLGHLRHRHQVDLVILKIRGRHDRDTSTEKFVAHRLVFQSFTFFEKVFVVIIYY